MSQRSNLKLGWQRLGPLFVGSRGRIGSLVITAFLGGVIEATLLLVVVKLALALAGHDERIAVALGPVDVTVRTTTVFGIAFGLVVVRLTLDLWAAFTTARVSTDVIGRTREEVFGDFMGASWDVQAKEEQGHIQDLLNRHVGKTSHAVLNVSNGLNALFNFLALLLSAFFVNVQAALAVVVTVLGLFFALRPISKAARRHATKQSEAGRRYSKTLVETVGMTMEIRSFGVTDRVVNRMVQLVKEDLRLEFLSQLLTKFVTPLYHAVALLLTLGGMVVLYTFWEAELAALGAIVLILLRALGYAQSLQSTYHRVVEVMPFAERLQNERRRFSVSSIPDGDRQLNRVRSLAFDRVTFSYGVGTPALDDVSFSVRRGEAIGIVGPSGAGKSTLIQLLLRLREPDQGRFLINGSDAATYRLSSWLAQVAFVPQDSRLLNASVRENIAFYRDCEEEDIERAARLAHIHDEIMSWSAGYDTSVGPRGSAVSGGQRQRIAIARALVGEPDVIIMDEPTSALDLRSESLIQQTLHELAGNVTVFIIAHRLSTLNACDRIMVLGNARLQAFDDRRVLEQTSDFYREVLELSQIA